MKRKPRTKDFGRLLSMTYVPGGAKGEEENRLNIVKTSLSQLYRPLVMIPCLIIVVDNGHLMYISVYLYYIICNKAAVKVSNEDYQ